MELFLMPLLMLLLTTALPVFLLSVPPLMVFLLIKRRKSRIKIRFILKRFYQEFFDKDWYILFLPIVGFIGGFLVLSGFIEYINENTLNVKTIYESLSDRERLEILEEMLINQNILTKQGIRDLIESRITIDELMK